LAFAGLFLVACQPQGQVGEKGEPAAQTEQALPKAPGKFDFYVLALSWSPSYCEAEGTGASPQQCGSGRRYAFIVHGLWPQFERGYPVDCKTDSERVPADLAQTLYDIMPSLGLIGHEWRRHGSCTGLDQQDFFATLRAARARLVIPEMFQRPSTYQTVSASEVERAFQDANPGLAPEAVSVSCDKRLLQEVRVCMTRELGFRACPELEKRSCRAQKLVMPPVRG
jgi:ribonuclease T2